MPDFERGMVIILKEIEQRNVRFYAKNEKHQKAWKILQDLSKQKSSQQDYIIEAIISLYESMQELADNPFLTTQRQEDKFINRIAEGVEKQIAKELPLVVSGFVMGLMANQNTTSPVLTSGNLSNESQKSEAEKIANENAIVTEVEENRLIDFDQIF